MASTTLNTFILPSPAFSVRAVELKGSWDNFSQSYQLKKDGHTGHWRGCHAFENIVCDGATMDVTSARDGGLKMGGTYWYFYILHTIDGDLEYHNAAEPSTASCPLLPGQQVNVLDVPVQADLVAGRNVSSTSLDSTVFTLDPRDKYLPPGVHRASTTSAIKTRKARPGPTPRIMNKANSAPLGVGAPPRSSTSSRDGQSTLDRQRSLMSVFHKIRQTRSAGSNAKSSLAWPRRLFSRTGQSAKIVAEDVPEVPKLPSHVSSIPAAPSGDVDLPTQQASTARTSLSTDIVSMSAPVDLVDVSWHQESTLLREHQSIQPPFRVSTQDSNPTSVFQEPDSSFAASSINRLVQLSIDDMQPTEPAISTSYRQSFGQQDAAPRIRAAKGHGNLRIAVNKPTNQEVYSLEGVYEPRNTEEHQLHEDKLNATTHSVAELSRLSYTLSENFSPGLASNTTRSGPTSPLHLSQPETPLMSDFDFEEDYDPEFLQLKRDSQSSSQLGTNIPEFVAPKPPSRAPPPPPTPQKPNPVTPRPALGGFRGYSLPADDQASVLTLRKPPSTTLKDTNNNGATFTPQADKQGLVRSWNDGSEHLLDDLGYLGEMIV